MDEFAGSMMTVTIFSLIMVKAFEMLRAVGNLSQNLQWHLWTTITGYLYYVAKFHFKDV